MPLGPILVIILRLVVPLSIRRWPLWGTMACLVLDATDVILIDVIKMGDFTNYAQVDKLLDVYYLSFALVVSLHWSDKLAKKTSIILFVYRLIGVILFELTQLRFLLFIFPNMFENWFLFWAARNRYFAQWQLTTKRLLFTLIALLIPKLAQEYVLHVREMHPWNWIQEKTGLLK
jgi:hypothetical protein